MSELENILKMITPERFAMVVAILLMWFQRDVIKCLKEITELLKKSETKLDFIFKFICNVLHIEPETSTNGSTTKKEASVDEKIRSH
jgi:hypothetical protein